MADQRNSHIPSREDAGWLKYAPAALALFAFLTISAYVYTFRHMPANERPESWGTFGDYLGGLLNPAISLFTLLVALKVWQLQRDELKLTREELIKQSETSGAQRREQRFFDCMAMYQRLVDSQTQTEGLGEQLRTVHGKAALRSLGNRVNWNSDIRTQIEYSRLRTIDDKIPPRTRSEILEEIEPNGLTGWLLDEVASYSRGLLSNLRICLDSLENTSERYLPLFREQLTDAEILIITAYMIFDLNADQYIETVARSHLLANLGASDIALLAKERLPIECFVLAAPK